MSLVLPTPPGPASVTSRAAESARRSVAPLAPHQRGHRHWRRRRGTGRGRYERGVLRQHGGLDRAARLLARPTSSMR